MKIYWSEYHRDYVFSGITKDFPSIRFVLNTRGDTWYSVFEEDATGLYLIAELN